MEQNKNGRRSVAYFSMEIGIDERVRTYSGGLGVLAGDTIRSAADLRVPMAAVTLLYRKGYFRQRLEADGWQREEPTSWAVEELLEEESPRTPVLVEGRTVQLRAWRYDVQGVGGYTGTDDTTLYQNRVDNSNGGFGFGFAGVTQDASPRRARRRVKNSWVRSRAASSSRPAWRMNASTGA